MTSSDVRDVLNLPTNDGTPRPLKKGKPSGPRPNLKGLAREVQSLGGDNPIVIAPEVTFKKRRLVNKKPAARWELRPFKNTARSDPTLILKHWRRKSEGQNGAPAGEDQVMENGAEPRRAESEREREMEDSAFSKYNVKVKVPQYSDDQYRSNLQNPDWTKEETDYLLELARGFDLRWPIIWDRYEYMPPALNGETGADGDESKAIIPAPKERSMEDLKARYYEVAAKMMQVQTPEHYMTDQEKNLYHIMLKFDAAAETTRKQFAAAFLGRPKDEAKEEENLLLEVRRIVARNKQFNEERRDLYRRLDYPHTDQDISSFKSSAGLQSLLQNLLAVDKSKKRKSLMAGDGVSPGMAIQAPPDSATSRRDSIAALSAGGPNRRESVSGAPAQTPTTATGKKGSSAVQQERRKLSEQEMIMYGVTYHDRLSSGPTFRTEKVNKMFSQRSGQMQTRITNVLSELDIPVRPTIPTAQVTAQYERLVAAIITLLDARKQADKLDGELKTEKAKKALREPPKDDAAQESLQSEAPKDKEAGGGADVDAGAEAGSATVGDNNTNKETTSTGTNPEAPADTGASATSEQALAAEGAPKSAVEAPSAEAGAAEAAEGAEKEAEKGAAGTTKEASAPSLDPEDVSMEGKNTDKEKTPRPGSSGHKRSASVFSTVSDKSTKRQKK